MASHNRLIFEHELSRYHERVYRYLRQLPMIDELTAGHVRDGTLHALRFGGKALRPAILTLCCGAVGGDEIVALPAAAAVELYHTWTLIHDDIIDRDAKRRGHPAVHEEFRRRAKEEFGFNEPAARHYGVVLGILAGDLLQGWSFACLCRLGDSKMIDPNVILFLIQDLTTRVQSTLVEGETLDVQYTTTPCEALTEGQILDMLRKKTAVLYHYAAQAGAMIGLNQADPLHPYVKSLASFAEKCGIAFQLRDDVLGIIGDESILGKPVGSDTREGKKTIISFHALQYARPEQREVLLRTLGNVEASSEEVQLATQLMIELGGVERAQELALHLVEEARTHLVDLPTTPFKQILLGWSEYLVSRDF